MEKTIYIPGDLVMTNGIPIGTKKGIVYQVTESNAEKIVKDGNEFTILRGSVTLSNIKGKPFMMKVSYLVTVVHGLRILFLFLLFLLSSKRMGGRFH